jgi:pimeloyl-ACP methyl ester carboxylesterase
VWDWYMRCSGLPPIAAVARQALWLDQLDMRPLLSEIRQPVLLVCGDCDRTVPWPLTEVLHRGLPNAGVAWIEGCGHVPSYSHPEALAAVVHRFLTPPQSCTEQSCPQACHAP